jgi:predicted transcriptional regulator
MIVMTRKQALPTPTPAELDLLKVLWKRGPSTVREIHEALPKTGRGVYTTALKLLQIMHDKGLVERDDSQRAHIYRPVFGKERTQRQLLQNFLGKVYEGSAAQLVMQALGAAKPADREELDRIRALLDTMEKEQP